MGASDNSALVRLQQNWRVILIFEVEVIDTQHPNIQDIGTGIERRGYRAEREASYDALPDLYFLLFPRTSLTPRSG